MTKVLGAVSSVLTGGTVAQKGRTAEGLEDGLVKKVMGDKFAGLKEAEKVWRPLGRGEEDLPTTVPITKRMLGLIVRCKLSLTLMPQEVTAQHVCQMPCSDLHGSSRHRLQREFSEVLEGHVSYKVPGTRDMWILSEDEPLPGVRDRVLQSQLGLLGAHLLMRPMHEHQAHEAVDVVQEFEAQRSKIEGLRDGELCEAIQCLAIVRRHMLTFREASWLFAVRTSLAGRPYMDNHAVITNTVVTQRGVQGFACVSAGKKISAQMIGPHDLWPNTGLMCVDKLYVPNAEMAS